MARSKMLDEIRQQPQALERNLRESIPVVRGLRRLFRTWRPRLIVLAARGTSDNAAQFGRYLLEIATGIPVSLAAPSVHSLYQARLDLAGTLVVAVSQSGESTDVNLVLERARASHAVTIGITNEAESTLAGLADHVLLVRAGRELSVAATKTYTGQLLAFYFLAHALGGDIPLAKLERLPAWAEAALRLESAMARRAERYRFLEHAVVVARGLNYANAFEFALKLMETSYVVADRFSAADFQHGPIALLESSFTLFLFAPAGPTWPPIRDVLRKAHRAEAETLIITDRANAPAARLPQAETIAVKLPELFTPIPYIIPAQLFAAHLAHVKGLDPDRPRSLRKVTRTL